jgi:hypothetical protein
VSSGTPTAGPFLCTPDFCSFTVDRRINPEENLEEEKHRLRKALEGFEIETLQEEAAAATPAADPLGVVLARHIASVTGKEPAFEMCPAPARNAILCRSWRSGLRLWTGIADRLPWTERVRSHPQYCPMCGDLRAHGGLDVGVMTSTILWSYGRHLVVAD